MFFDLQGGSELIAFALHTGCDHFPRQTHQLADIAVAY